jgi:hypothetical protein
MHKDCFGIVPAQYNICHDENCFAPYSGPELQLLGSILQITKLPF